MFFFMTFTESTVYNGKYSMWHYYFKAGDIYCDYP